MNGRYFIIADVVLNDGTFLKDVEFDADSRVAIKYYGKRTITKGLVVCDCSWGTCLRKATSDERRAFELENRPQITA